MAEFTRDLSGEETLFKLKAKQKEKEAELKKLEEQKKKELHETEESIKKIAARAESERTKKQREEEERRLQELEDQRKAIQKELESLAPDLESLVAREKPREEGTNIQYMIEELQGGNASIYTVTNYNVYRELTQIRDKVIHGEYLNEKERVLIEETKRQAERFATGDDKDPNSYIIRASDVIDQINRYMQPGKHLRHSDP